MFEPRGHSINQLGTMLCETYVFARTSCQEEVAQFRFLRDLREDRSPREVEIKALAFWTHREQKI